MSGGTFRIRDAGDSALLLQCDPVIDVAVNARVIAIAEAVRAQRIGGVRDVVSTFSSVAVYFDPLRLPADAVRDALLSAANAPYERSAGARTIEVPVSYGGEAGPDIADLARMTGLTETEIAGRHSQTTYRVFMLGFLPGFAYMASVDDSIAAPRRPSPRLRVPAGSVGIAGRQTGIYPIESPGGWQIIGRTATRVFDPARAEPCLFAPGDSVRFVDVRRNDINHPTMNVTEDSSSGVQRTLEKSADTTFRAASAAGRTLTPAITVVSPGLFTTIQDEGRWGHQGSGVSVSGALDLVSHRMANAAVGNHRSAATLEITVQGPQLRFDRDAVIAVAGADLSATLDGGAVAHCCATRCRPGSLLRFGDRRGGARAYVSVSGGIDVAPVLGSRSTHAMTGIGGFSGRQLRAGDVLAIGHSSSADRPSPIAIESIAHAVRLRAVPGPQDDFFAPAAFDILERTRFTISPQSNRMGYRLTGAEPIPRSGQPEMISDATFPGGIQVPPSGEPILLMADRQTTGGYPQIATVITADLSKAAQLAPGDSVQFELCSRADAIAALVAQEARLRASN